MGRTPCCDKNGLKKGPWTPEEDQKLVDYIKKHGYGNWRTLPKNAGLQRCGKSCRLRWTNYLRPDIKRGKFSLEEDETIVKLHSILGNKWSTIAARLPGRTDNEIKNYWNTNIRKRLLQMGIDPITHNPRLDLLDLSSIFGYNNTNNLSTLLGVQQQAPILSQELLRLATSQHDQNQIILNNQENQFPINRFGPTTGFQELPTININYPSMSEPQFIEPNFEQYPSNVTNYISQGMGSNLNQDYVLALSNYCDENQNFGFESVLSTPSSSPTPLNSNSTTYVNGSCSPEHERESYCSSILNFNNRISDMLINGNNSM